VVARDDDGPTREFYLHSSQKRRLVEEIESLQVEARPIFETSRENKEKIFE
jgi:hypothetical protein